ncbi:hypothetical protein DN390_24610 [Bacillus sp. SH7-1]|nr:hypothetical protein DN390_24610 [Bacillus sp. SH7-1]
MITTTPLFVKFSANKLTYLTKKFPKNNLLESTPLDISCIFIIFPYIILQRIIYLVKGIYF